MVARRKPAGSPDARSFRDAYKVTLRDGRVVHNYSGAWGVTEAAKKAFSAHPNWDGDESKKADRVALVYAIIEGIEEAGHTPTATKVARELGGIQVEGLIPEVRTCISQLKRDEKIFVTGKEKYFNREHEILSTTKPTKGKGK